MNDKTTLHSESHHSYDLSFCSAGNGIPKPERRYHCVNVEHPFFPSGFIFIITSIHSHSFISPDILLAVRVGGQHHSIHTSANKFKTTPLQWSSDSVSDDLNCLLIQLSPRKSIIFHHLLLFHCFYAVLPVIRWCSQQSERIDHTTRAPTECWIYLRDANAIRGM